MQTYIFQEIFLKDHRQWTSVRDNHMENANKNYTGASYRAGSALQPLEYKYSLQNENCVVTDDIVNIDNDADDDTNAIEEAEKLLDQLDLLSSSDN